MSAKVVSYKYDLDDCENVKPPEAFESKCIIAENINAFH
jgi:hypothetical protein